MTGRFATISDSEYFAHPALDQTMLKKFMESPRAYEWARQHPQHDSQFFAFGRAMHSIVLSSGPVPTLKPDARTKTGRAKIAEYKQDDVDRVMLTRSDMTLLDDMSACMPVFDPDKGRPETAMFATIQNIPCKGKADWLPNGADADGVYRIRDYKTIAGDPRRFPYDAYTFGYHIQAAFYMRLYRECVPDCGPLGFEFVVQSKRAPYDWMLWRFDETQPEISMVADPLIDNALSDYAWWADRNQADMLDYGLDKTPHTIQYTDNQMTKAIEGLDDLCQ